MVIDTINVGGFSLLKTEHNPPVGPHRYGVKPEPLALERVQPVAG